MEQNTPKSTSGHSNIRLIRPNELDRLIPILIRFFEESKSDFSPNIDLFKLQMIKIMAEGSGFILIEETPEGLISGSIAGVIHPCLFSGTLRATELWWYVDKPYRGGRTGFMLLKTYEKYLQELGVKYSNMIHLENLSPELSTIYPRLGYDPAERVFTKKFN